MADEVVLGRLATPVEKPLDKPVDIFCQDVACLTPREVSRYHAMVFRLGDAQKHYLVRDLGSSCGTFVNGKRLPTGDPSEAIELSHGDVISLGPSHVNTYLFMMH
ncbi:MAG TPA: FHA domain-containing protein [Candidatus Angelobacter sp.]|nr:FHA domain-containing protein [Candidatus Angelobacter sp.]